MAVTIAGSRLGDEGKGALVDLWDGSTDTVVRYQGGDDAGRTVVEDGEEHKLSLILSGAVHDEIGVLEDGCAINPRTLFSKIDDLRERGLDLDVRLTERAHIIMPYHRRLDNIKEEARAGSDLIVGTTGRGIGPTYEDKTDHRGTHVGDLLGPDVLRQRLKYVVPQERALIENMCGLEAGEECDVEALVEKYTEIDRRLHEDDMAVNCGDFLVKRREAGSNVTSEGVQDTLIDIDHRSYPYVTSSNPTVGGTATGTGVDPTIVGQDKVVGIVKSYLSRVGKGPMPTELKGDDRDEKLAEFVHEKDGEFGTVTGRPRRIG